MCNKPEKYIKNLGKQVNKYHAGDKLDKIKSRNRSKW